MRTTIDLPDKLFRRTKALAAERGLTMKQVVARAVEREVDAIARPVPASRKVEFPLFHLRSGRKLDLRNFDFDDLLA